eukprot:7278816-Alexandrium_andersonii.AAC.1
MCIRDSLLVKQPSTVPLARAGEAGCERTLPRGSRQGAHCEEKLSGKVPLPPVPSKCVVTHPLPL